MMCMRLEGEKRMWAFPFVFLKKELELAGEGELKVGGVGSGEGKELVP